MYTSKRVASSGLWLCAFAIPMFSLSIEASEGNSCASKHRKGNLWWFGASIVNSVLGNVVLWRQWKAETWHSFMVAKVSSTSRWDNGKYQPFEPLQNGFGNEPRGALLTIWKRQLLNWKAVVDHLGGCRGLSHALWLDGWHSCSKCGLLQCFWCQFGLPREWNCSVGLILNSQGIQRSFNCCNVRTLRFMGCLVAKVKWRPNFDKVSICTLTWFQ